jgi:hypothetical protein
MLVSMPLVRIDPDQIKSGVIQIANRHLVFWPLTPRPAQAAYLGDFPDTKAQAHDNAEGASWPALAWGAPRIHGELLKLGSDHPPSTSCNDAPRVARARQPVFAEPRIMMRLEKSSSHRRPLCHNSPLASLFKSERTLIRPVPMVGTSRLRSRNKGDRVSA